ncbi:MAG TPA: PAS domain-containing sensor histidine kinase [Gemmatimonadaceae bacterium]|nr:PAS domain-containing sensor histidine kinase [Gemmatimonadaceae bacterium]
MPETTRGASEAKFAAILDIAADAIITIDEARRIIHFNKGAEEIFGYTAEEVLGKELELLLPERFRATHPRYIREFGDSAEPARRMGHRREVSGLRKDGREFPAEASISKIDIPGEGRFYTAVVRDVTERYEAEARSRFLVDGGRRLSESLAFDDVVRAIVSQAVPMFGRGCVLDITGADDDEVFRRAVHAADAAMAAALEGLSRHAITVDSPSAAIDAIRRASAVWVERLDDEWLEAHEETQDAVALWKRTGATALWILPLTVGGRAIGALSILRTEKDFDTPEARTTAAAFADRAAVALEHARLYDAARRATRARDDVLAVVSHDLRNPLSAITMCAAALREGGGDAAARDELLQAIAEAAEWAQRLIRDLLDVSALDAGALALERTAVPLGEVVTRATTMLEADFEGRGVLLTADIPEPRACIWADADRVVQVIANLLGNAVKFTERGGRVTVRVRSDDGYASIAVEDTGAGIPAEEQARIFDRYWQSRRGAARRGAGLGLAIAKGIVEAHGGRIGVASEPGRGSTFTFEIPLAAPNRP